MTTYVIDIDGTICTEPPDDGSLEARLNSFRIAQPINVVIDKIKRLPPESVIVLFTARGMNIVRRLFPHLTHVEQGSIADKLFRPVTEEWLHHHNIPYSRLIFGKPSADYYVDDKALTPGMFMGPLS